ncbi:hypothetical protein [Occultella gossypii]|uniref:PH domain-containing protein n=1 Tax=Occultella gossypii TaxID=2800820 RepID=A0ABS7SCN6_9MICO|nr:hypothetical protein [Occultella gossypii]MBZ2198119.1 hypothetical protein [Occultella gossypii]
MPRAQQMPRTRRIRRLQLANRVVALSLVAVGAVVVRATAGEQWWWPVVGFAAFVVVVGAAAGWVGRRLSARQSGALAADRAELSVTERGLPFGVVGSGGDLLLPTKTGTVVLAVVVTILLLAVGGAALFAGDPFAVGLGIVFILAGLWCAALTWWIRGTRIRLTKEGIESTMGPRRFHPWLEVADLKVDRAIIIVKAAGARRPRVWIRCGLLEVSVPDCVAMIHRQRGW